MEYTLKNPINYFNTKKNASEELKLLSIVVRGHKGYKLFLQFDTVCQKQQLRYRDEFMGANNSSEERSNPVVEEDDKKAVLQVEKMEELDERSKTFVKGMFALILNETMLNLMDRILLEYGEIDNIKINNNILDAIFSEDMDLILLNIFYTFFLKKVANG